MDFIDSIEQAISILYPSKNNNNPETNTSTVENIQKANQYLSSMISIQHYDLFKQLLCISQNPNTKFYALNSLNKIIPDNYITISFQEKESVISLLYSMITLHTTELFTECQYLLNGIISLMTKLIRYIWINEHASKVKCFLIELMAKAKSNDFYMIIASFRICSEIMVKYKNKDMPPLDKIQRIIADFKQECLQIIIHFCFDVLLLICNESFDKESIDKGIILIKEITICLNDCVDYDKNDLHESKGDLKPINIQLTGNLDNQKNVLISCETMLIISQKIFGLYKELINTINSPCSIDNLLILLEKLLIFTIDYNPKEKDILFYKYQTAIWDIVSKNNETINPFLITNIFNTALTYFSPESIISSQNIFNSLNILLNACLSNITLELSSIINIITFYSKLSSSIACKNKEYQLHCYNMLTSILNSISLIVQNDNNNVLLLNGFIPSFGKCSSIVYNDMLYFLMTLLSKANQMNEVGVIIAIITSTIKQSFDICSEYDITLVCLVKICNICFNQTNVAEASDLFLHSLISFNKILISLFIGKKTGKEMIMKLVDKSNLIINPDELVLKVIVFLLSIMNAPQVELYIRKIVKCLNEIDKLMLIQYDSILNCKRYHCGNIILTPVTFNDTVYQGIQLLTVKNLKGKEKETRLIQHILFKMLLLINEPEVIMNLVFNAITKDTLQSNDSSLCIILNTLIALINAISLKVQYIFLIEKLSPFLSVFFELYSSEQVSIYTKTIILKLFKYITFNSNNRISFEKNQFQIPGLINDIILKSLSYFINLINQSNKTINQLSSSDNIYQLYIQPISLYIKILKNILINNRNELYRNTMNNQDYIIKLHQNIIHLYFSIPKQDRNSYVKKLKGIYELIRYFYCTSEKKILFILEESYINQVIEMICEGIDSLDNVILITCHQIIYLLGKDFIENQINSIFIKYSDLFQAVLKRLLTIVSKGEITSINDVTNTILVLVIIYKNDYPKIIQEMPIHPNNSINMSQIYMKLFDGIEQNLYSYNVTKLKERLKELAQGNK